MLIQVNDSVEVTSLGKEGGQWVRLSVMGGSFIVERPAGLAVPVRARVATLRCRVEEFSRPGKSGEAPRRTSAFVVEGIEDLHELF